MNWDERFLHLVSERFDYLVDEFGFLKQATYRIGDNGQEGFLVCSYVLRSQPCVAVLVVFDTVEFNVNVIVKRLPKGHAETTLYDRADALHLSALVVWKSGSDLLDDIPFPQRKPKMTAKELDRYLKEERIVFEKHFEEIISRFAVALRKFGVRFLRGDTKEFDLVVDFAKKRAAEEMRLRR